VILPGEHPVDHPAASGVPAAHTAEGPLTARPGVRDKTRAQDGAADWFANNVVIGAWIDPDVGDAKGWPHAGFDWSNQT
jgi:hypothetical protein